MKSSIFTSLLFLSSGILLGGGTMYLLHISSSANHPTEGIERNVVNNSNGSSSAHAPQLNGDSTRHALSNVQPSLSLEDPSLHTNAFRRKLAIYTYVAGLSVQDLKTKLEELSSGSQKLSLHVQDELQSALVERLTIVNPETAVEFAVVQKVPDMDRTAEWYTWQDSSGEPAPLYMPVVRSVFSDWALSDLKDAISKAKSLSGDAKSNALSGILTVQEGQSLATYRQIARDLGDEERGVAFYVQSFSSGQIDDPKAAWREVIDLLDPNNYNHSIALNNIVKQWYEQDGFNVLDEIRESTLDSEIKHGAIHQILWQAAEENPAQAFQYALNMPSEGRHSPTLYTVVRKWSESDPQAAFQAVSAIEKSGQREQLQQTVAGYWARQEPWYVLENLDNFPNNIHESLRANAIREIARTSPKEAAELALEHTEAMRYSSLPWYVLNEWIEQDVEAAINWVYNGPVKDKDRYGWVQALTRELVDSDPRRAFDLAVKYDIPEDADNMGMGRYQEGLEADVISRITYDDLDLAVELLPQVREGITKTRAYTSVGSRYIENGHSTKALELGLKLPLENQASYFQSIAYSWARIDPAGLVESIKRLPTEEIRTRIAATLSSQWARENFTDEQIDTLKQYLSESARQALEDQ
ncbi:MAG: hypothetical protein F4W92_10310 [Gammaproteobacteria bacterium]|nr:hypothetical protein [Gammaproteobacteria bacterium]